MGRLKASEIIKIPNYNYAVHGKPYTGTFLDLQSAERWKEKHGTWLEQKFNLKLELVTTYKHVKK